LDTKRKILIIDDDPDFVEAIKKILETASYQVESASNAKEGWEKIIQFQPNLICMDIMMETLTDGFLMSQDIKNHSDFHHIPILCISSINQVTHLHFSPETDGKAFPVDDFMEKPVQPDDLLRHIEMLFNHHTVPNETEEEWL